MKSTFQQIMHLYFLRATNSEQCAALVLNTKLLGLLSNNNKKNKNGLTEKLNEIWKKKTEIGLQTFITRGKQTGL